MKSFFFGLFILLSTNAVDLAQADAKGYGQLKVEVVPTADDLMVFVVNDGPEDLEIYYPFSLSFDGGGAGDLELTFQPVGRSPQPPEGRLCASVQSNASAIPKSRVLWAGALFGRRFDRSYIKRAFCLRKGVYEISAKLYVDDKSPGAKVSSSASRVVIE